jgi:hypothetical protein
MNIQTTATGAGNTTAAHFVIKHVAHPTYDPTERQTTILDDCGFSDDQIAARFVTRHGGSVISVNRWDDERGIWVGPEKVTSYRVIKAGNPDGWLGHVFNNGNGWIFRSMAQIGSSRREWPTPEAALKGRVKNYELVAASNTERRERRPVPRDIHSI